MTEIKKKIDEAIEKKEVTDSARIINSLVIYGDLSQMSPRLKIEYYKKFCESLDLNPLTQPFNLLRLNNKEVLYANKNCCEQLRNNYAVSVIDMKQEIFNDVYTVTVKVQNKCGRTDIEVGSVPIKGLTGDKLANAMMKASTKAKRRATLSICSIGVMDETEIETVEGVTKLDINKVDEIKEPQANKQTEIKRMIDEMKLSEERKKQYRELYIKKGADVVFRDLMQEYAEWKEIQKEWSGDEINK